MIKPDGIQFFSRLPQYTELAPATGSLVLVGNGFPDGFSHTFSTTLSIDSNATRVDLYATNSNTGKKQLLSSTGFPAVYQNVSGELAQHTITFGSNSLTWDLTITNNTGGPVTLIDQTFNLEAICYILPI